MVVEDALFAVSLLLETVGERYALPTAATAASTVKFCDGSRSDYDVVEIGKRVLTKHLFLTKFPILPPPHSGREIRN